MLEQFLDMFADRVAARLAIPANTTTPWASLGDVAARLGWTPRHLKSFCARNGIGIAGTPKHLLVDPAGVAVALDGTRRESRTAPPRDRIADLVQRRTGGSR